MSTIKDFIKTIRSSFYDPAFYENVRTLPLFSAVKIFAVLGLVGIGFSMLLALPALVSFAYSDLPQAVEDAFPSDLVVTIQNGEMSINQPQPYYIKNTLDTLAGSSTPKYIAIFDGTDQLPNDLLEDSTFILLKDKFAIAPGQNNSQQVIPFSRFGTTTIDKSTVVGIVDKVKPYFIPGVLGGGALMFILFVVFGTIFWILFHMIYILIPALLIYLFNLFRTTKLAYKESYMVTLYASIPVAIIFFVVFDLVLHISAPMYTYTLALLVAVIVNTAGLQNQR